MRLPTGPAGVSAGWLRLTRPLFERALHDALHIGDDKRLADVIERPRTNRFDCRFERAKSTNEHDGGAMVCFEPTEQVEPGTRRIQVDVRNQQVEQIMTDLHQGAVGVLYQHELAVRSLEQFFEEGACVCVVVDHQDARHG